MSYLIKPKNYKPLLDLKQTELGIKQIKEFYSIQIIIDTHSFQYEKRGSHTSKA